jgi:hypothetical protein
MGVPGSAAAGRLDVRADRLQVSASQPSSEPAGLTGLLAVLTVAPLAGGYAITGRVTV